MSGDKPPVFYPLPIKAQDRMTFVELWKRIRSMLDEDDVLCKLFYPSAAVEILNMLSIANAWSIQPLNALFPQLANPADKRGAVVLQVCEYSFLASCLNAYNCQTATSVLSLYNAVRYPMPILTS